MAGKDADLNLELGGGKKKGKGKLFLIIGIAVAVLAGGGGAAFFLLGKKGGKADAEHEEAKAEHSEPAAHASFVPLKDNFVVNISDDKRGRVAQIGISLMSHSPNIALAVEQNLPLIRSVLLELFSAQNASELLTPEGKEKLRAEALKRLNAIFEEAKSEDKIDKVLFTNLVMQ